MYGVCSELKLCTEQQFWAHMLGASKYMYGATIIGCFDETTPTETQIQCIQATHRQKG